MKDKTKVRVANTVTAFTAVYAIVALGYVYPSLLSLTQPLLLALMSHFLLVPFAIVGVVIVVAAPLALLLVALYFVEMGMHKALGTASKP